MGFFKKDKIPQAAPKSSGPLKPPTSTPTLILDDRGGGSEAPTRPMDEGTSSGAKTRWIGEHEGGGDPSIEPVVGWLVVIEGPGKGAFRPLADGFSKIGRGPDQHVTLDFGDNKISNDKHFEIGYDDKQRTFVVIRGESRNPVRLNDKMLASEADLHHGDKLEVGDTTLMFVPFCAPEFFGWPEE